MESVVVELSDHSAGEMELEGIVVPFFNLGLAPQVQVRLHFDGGEYTFSGSAPAKGYGATLPDRVRQALQEGRQALVLRRRERLYLYLTPAPESPPP